MSEQHQSQSPPPPPPPSAYRPDGLPDHLYGGDKGDKGTIDALFKGYNGARGELANLGAVPKDGESYNFSFSDRAKPFIKGDDDKAVKVFNDISRKFGLRDKQAGLANAFIEGLIDAKIIEAPVDPNVMFAGMAPVDFKGNDIEKIAAGKTRQTNAQNWITGLSEQHGFDKEMRDELALLASSPAGLRVAELMMKGGVQKTVQTAGEGSQGGLTKQQVDARMADPRNNRNDPKYDQAFANETRELYKKLYPG